MKPKKESLKQQEQDFYMAINSIETLEEAKAFFSDLCSPAELQAMVDRWQVVLELKQEKSYRTIQEQTGVSVTTVGRVARTLSTGAGGYESVYQKIKKS